MVVSWPISCLEPIIKLRSILLPSILLPLPMIEVFDNDTLEFSPAVLLLPIKVTLPPKLALTPEPIFIDEPPSAFAPLPIAIASVPLAVAVLPSDTA